MVLPNMNPDVIYSLKLIDIALIYACKFWLLFQEKVQSNSQYAVDVCKFALESHYEG